MKFLRFVVVVVGTGLFLGSCAMGQEASPPSAVPSQEPDEHPGKVIMSRSVDDSGSTPAASPATPAAKPAEAPTDAEREAITFLSYDLDVHLRPKEHAMAVRARVALRNDSASPLHRLPLQISSTLQWTSVRIADAPATFSQQLVNSDIDHTGVLREAVIALAQPLEPQQTIAVDLTYAKEPLLFPRPGWSRLEPRRRWQSPPIGTVWRTISWAFGASATWLGTRSLPSQWLWAMEPSFFLKQRRNGNVKARPR